MIRIMLNQNQGFDVSVESFLMALWSRLSYDDRKIIVEGLREAQTKIPVPTLTHPDMTLNGLKG